MTGDDEWLSALRAIGDAPADAYVAAQLANVDSRRREWLTAAVAALRGATPSDAAWATEWELRAVDPPPWMDDDLLRKGQDVFDDWALDLTTALFCASLPHAYASGRGAAVLASVSELADGRRVEKRISLTGQMLLDITTPGALAVGAVGYRTVRRVRLLHACVRALLLLGDAAGNPWPTGARGLPINQQDMVGTQLAFTIAAFDGIMRLGYRMSKADKRAYLHLWSVVGHYLGITEAARLADLAVAKRLTRELEVSLQETSPWGKALMQTLLDDMSARMPRPLRIPARRARAQARGPRGGRPAGRAAQQVGARRGRRRRLRAVGLAGDDRAVDPAAALAAARPGPDRALDRGGHGRRPIPHTCGPTSGSSWRGARRGTGPSRAARPRGGMRPHRRSARRRPRRPVRRAGHPGRGGHRQVRVDHPRPHAGCGHDRALGDGQRVRRRGVLRGPLRPAAPRARRRRTAPRPAARRAAVRVRHGLAHHREPVRGGDRRARPPVAPRGPRAGADHRRRRPMAGRRLGGGPRVRRPPGGRRGHRRADRGAVDARRGLALRRPAHPQPRGPRRRRRRRGCSPSSATPRTTSPATAASRRATRW